MTQDLQPVRTWLATFARAVRERDFEAGRQLFLPDAVGFGTVAGRVENLDELVARQWKPIWEHTEGFDFDYVGLHGEISGGLAWIATRWSSRRHMTEGEPVLRTGRCTLVLKEIDGVWRAAHSHFSRTPSETTSDDSRP